MVVLLRVTVVGACGVLRFVYGVGVAVRCSVIWWILLLAGMVVGGGGGLSLVARGGVADRKSVI